MKQIRIAILLFDDAEVLDFCGPLEVFSVAGQFAPNISVDVVTTAQQSPVRAASGLSVNPDYLLDQCPKPNVLLVPGGIGTRTQMHNDALLAWIRDTAADCQLLLSVCTGALLLASAGLLDGLQATTHHVAFDLLRDIAPNTVVHEDRRFVDNGKVITSAGIAAGIDMSLHVVSRLFGAEVARQTASQMEYPTSLA